MRWLLFLSRMAFICNVFFVLAISLQITHWLHNEDVVATIIVLGYAMAALFNPFVNLCYAFYYFVKKEALCSIPAWLRVSNFVFLLFQVIYILYLNDY